MNDTLFLLGAGFNRDAIDETGPIECESIYVGKYAVSPSYPLVTDMWKICFPNMPVDPSVAIEEKIQECMLQGNMEPVNLLCKEISRCDHYLIPRLAQIESCYRKFFERYSDSDFLTFNYDSLVEVSLLRKGVWHPFEGYGIPIELGSHLTNGGKCKPGTSQIHVIHLHGSICIYESTVDWDTSGKIPYLQMKKSPVFKFDASSIAKLFYPFQSAAMTLGENREIEQRVIAPVPDKSTGLKGAFVKEMYKKAKQLVAQSRRLICIGYDFNRNDYASYEPILQEINNNSRCESVIVSPNAKDIVVRISDDFPDLDGRFRCVQATFKQWAQRDFEVY